MVKMRGGLSRSQVPKMTKSTRLTRLSGIRRISTSPLVTDRDSTGLVKIEVTPCSTGRYTPGRYSIVKHDSRKPHKIQLDRFFAAQQSKLSTTIAASLVKDCTLQVMQEVGIHRLADIVRPETIITPKIAHSLGQIVATRVIGMAGEFIAVGSAEGGGSSRRGRIGGCIGGRIGSSRGGRLGTGAISEIIGSSDVEVSISSDGEISTTVTPHKKSKKKVDKPVENSAIDVTKKEPSNDVKPAVEESSEIIFKEKNGTIIIHLHVHIDAQTINQIILNTNKYTVTSDSETLIVLLQKMLEATIKKLNKKDDDEGKKKGGKKGKK